ncbi:MAG: DNA topoisomerase III [Bacteriovorax sp.]|nr:DNA topoisomerase III [Bacteriovorax sp.]
MMKTLILTEKPSVARDFASALAGGRATGGSSDGYIETDDYVITWAIGHLLAPFDPADYDSKFKRWSLATLPILPTEFKFKAQPKTKKQLDVIKRLLKRTDLERLIVATDAGREGELIARLILNEGRSKLKSFRFFTSAALTKEVIHHELKKLKPLQEYDRLYIAGRARQKADWLVGMNLSRLATLKLNDLFSVGRVQTAVLGLIVERRKAIEAFVPQDYFEMKANFKFKNGMVEAYWFDPKKKTKDDIHGEKRQDKREFFDQLVRDLSKKDANITVLNETEKTQYPEGLYSLTELQRQANIRYGFSATKTLEIAQTLYEKYKCLSYPRTDSKVMAESSFDLVKDLVYKFKGLYPEHFEKFAAFKVSVKNKTIFDDSRLTDHHGLVPLKDFSGNESTPEGKIFHLVLRRFISNFLENHKYLDTEVEITCEKNLFKTRGKKIIEMGFKVLEGRENEELLPPITLNETGLFNDGLVESKKTKAPSDYTEASLLYDMTNPARLVSESDLKKIFRSEIGLGTQATRAQIIETLLKRIYIERSGKSLLATDKGVQLVDQLSLMPSTSELTSVSQTAKLELKLQAMAEGENDDAEFLDSINKYVESATSEWKSIETVAGEKKEKSYTAKNTLYNKTSSGIENERTPKISLGPCPLCKSEVKDFPKSFSCERWREGCGFTIWKIVANKKLSESQVKTLMIAKKTDLIKGFKSKAGKPFEAYLLLNPEGKVEFEFKPRQA